MTEPLLELSALAPERPKALLKTEGDPDGTIYELALPQDFGAVALAVFGQLQTELDELWGRKKLSAAEGKHMERILDRLAVSLVRDAPAAAVKALPVDTKRALVFRFLAAGGMRAIQTMGPETSALLTSETSSPAASASTAATL